jgi:citrate synthase
MNDQNAPARRGPTLEGTAADWTWPAEHEVGPGLGYDRATSRVIMDGRDLRGLIGEWTLDDLVCAWVADVCDESVNPEAFRHSLLSLAVTAPSSPAPGPAILRLRAAFAAAAPTENVWRADGIARVFGALVTALIAASDARIEELADAGLAPILLQAAGGPADALADPMLMLALDDALGPEAFAALVVGSCLSNPRSVGLASLAAASGTRATGAITSLFDVIGPEASEEAVAEWARDHLESRRRIPGFGHRLFPHGDPRVAPALAQLRGAGVDLGGIDRVCRVAADVLTRARRFAPAPNLLLPLAAWLHARGLSAGRAAALLASTRTVAALLRTAGYVRDNRIFRPLDRYVGPAPRPLSDTAPETWS